MKLGSRFGKRAKYKTPTDQKFTQNLNYKPGPFKNKQNNHSPAMKPASPRASNNNHTQVCVCVCVFLWVYLHVVCGTASLGSLCDPHSGHCKQGTTTTRSHNQGQRRHRVAKDTQSTRVFPLRRLPVYFKRSSGTFVPKWHFFLMRYWRRAGYYLLVQLSGDRPVFSPRLPTCP